MSHCNIKRLIIIIIIALVNQVYFYVNFGVSTFFCLKFLITCLLSFCYHQIYLLNIAMLCQYMFLIVVEHGRP
jgi:hypothetical protein